MFFRLLAYKLHLAKANPNPLEADSTMSGMAGDLVDERFPGRAPLRVFAVPYAPQPRISIVTDSINSGSLYGGVGMAMILGALLARPAARDSES